MSESHDITDASARFDFTQAHNDDVPWPITPPELKPLFALISLPICTSQVLPTEIQKIFHSEAHSKLKVMFFDDSKDIVKALRSDVDRQKKNKK